MFSNGYFGELELGLKIWMFDTWGCRIPMFFFFIVGMKQFGVEFGTIEVFCRFCLVLLVFQYPCFLGNTWVFVLACRRQSFCAALCGLNS